MTFLEKWPTGARIAVVLLVALILGGALYFLLFKPNLDKMAALKKEGKMLRQELARSRHVTSSYRQLTKEEKELWEETEKSLKLRFPPPEDYPSKVDLDVEKGVYYGNKLLLVERPPQLFQDLIGMARASKILTTMRLSFVESPQDHDRRGLKWTSRAFELKFDCRYPQLMDFINRLNGAGHFMRVEYMEIAKQVPLVSVKLVVRAHYM